MNNMFTGEFPNVVINPNFILDFYDEYFKELNDGSVYFTIYSIGRKSEFGLICDGQYMCRRAAHIESCESFFERIKYNPAGKLRIQPARDTKEDFYESYKAIIQQS